MVCAQSLTSHSLISSVLTRNFSKFCDISNAHHFDVPMREFPKSCRSGTNSKNECLELPEKALKTTLSSCIPEETISFSTNRIRKEMSHGRWRQTQSAHPTGDDMSYYNYCLTHLRIHFLFMWCVKILWRCLTHSRILRHRTWKNKCDRWL